MKKIRSKPQTFFQERAQIEAQLGQLSDKFLLTCTHANSGRTRRVAKLEIERRAKLEE